MQKKSSKTSGTYTAAVRTASTSSGGHTHCTNSGDAMTVLVYSAWTGTTDEEMSMND